MFPLALLCVVLFPLVLLIYGLVLLLGLAKASFWGLEDLQVSFLGIPPGFSWVEGFPWLFLVGVPPWLFLVL